ncbi:MAG: hypothetical protein H7X79_01000 [Sporomusaceae bacterium]|nr:hypothetical protein [Sporomusaceae bacterium]
MDKEKVYETWNGKNIGGQVEFHNSFLSKQKTENNTSEMAYAVGVDTFSGDELQEDQQY